MTQKRIVGLALALTLTGAIPAFSQTPAADDAAALVQELRGQGAAQTRTPDQWQSAYARALDSLLPDMGGSDLAKQGTAQDTWEKIVLRTGRTGAEAERAAVTRAMLAKIGDETPQAARLWLIKQIGHAGRAEAVSPLTGLLSNQDPLVRERALRALTIVSVPEAAQALRTALDSATAPADRVAYINALAQRRDAAAIPALTRLSADSDAGVVSSAVAGLGRIGGPDAVKALTALEAKAAPAQKRAVADALLMAANGYAAQGRKTEAAAIYERYAAATQPRALRFGALRGLALTRGVQAAPALTAAMTGSDDQLRLTAVRLTAEVPGTEATTAFAALLPRVPAPAQEALLEELGKRGDGAARAAVLGLTTSPNEGVRLAAFRALGGVGNAVDVALLAKTAAGEGVENAAARDSLARLSGAGVDDALLASAKAGATPIRVEALRAVALRRPAGASAVLLAAAADADAAIRTEAIKGLGSTGDAQTVPGLVALLVKAPSDDQREAAQRALVAIANRLGDRTAASQQVLAGYNSAAAPVRRSLLPVLAVTGGGDALATIRAAVKDSDTGVQDAGVRALAAWQDPAVAPDLLEIARTSASTTHKVLALQGYTRVAALGDRSAADRLKLYQDGLGVAIRPEEKRQLLGSLGDVSTIESLRVVQPYLSEEPVREEAAAAAVKIAKNLRNAPGGEVRPVLEKVVQVSKNDNTTKEANSLLQRYK